MCLKVRSKDLPGTLSTRNRRYLKGGGVLWLFEKYALEYGVGRGWGQLVSWSGALELHQSKEKQAQEGWME